jgi:hypothetical protein
VGAIGWDAFNQHNRNVRYILEEAKMNAKTGRLVSALIGITILLFGNVTLAQKDKRIRFAKGSNAGIVKGVIRKPESGETYLIGAKAGQKMLLDFDAIGSAMPFIQVFPPGKTSEDSRLLDAGAGGEDSVDLATSGDYSIFIGCMRPCAYTLKVSIK